MSRILLIGCGKSKKNSRDSAENLYTGSLFRARREHAQLRKEARGEDWHIVSAKYGLLSPDQLIDPYDLKITDLPILDRRAWALDVVHGVLDLLPDTITTSSQLRDVVLELHAGVDCVELLEPVILAAGMSYDWPVKGLSQGEQMSYYAKQRILYL